MKCSSYVIKESFQSPGMVKRGSYIVNTARAKSDFYFVQADDPETAVGRVIELVKTRIPKRFGLDSGRLGGTATAPRVAVPHMLPSGE